MSLTSFLILNRNNGYRGNGWRNIYKFECECPKCKLPNPDEDFLNFHRYRCEKEDCRQVFVPRLSQIEWWCSDRMELLECPKCGAEQRCQWLGKFNNLLDCANSAFNRRLLYKIFDDSGHCLLDYHEIKMYMAFQLVLNGFSAHSELSDGEFAKLADVMKFYLRGVAEKSRINSIEYVVKMTYLRDMIALGKCKCTRVEMKDMLLDIISD